MTKIKNVLLIDDDNLFNYINKETIKMENFAENVTSHCFPEKALEELAALYESGGKDFPDVIFLDINMPRMDGWEFLQEFEKLPETILNKCSVYMLTSSIDPNDIEKSKTYRTVKKFTSKPLSPEFLQSLAQSEVTDFQVSSKPAA